MKTDNTPDECYLLLAQNPKSIYSYVPESVEILRSILSRVNLRAWLQNLVCSPPEKDGTPTTDNGSGRKKIDGDVCRDVVEAALATQPHVQASLVPQDGNEKITIR